MTTDITQVVAKLNQLNMSTINAYYKDTQNVDAGTEGIYVEIIDMSSEKVSTDINIATDMTVGNNKHGLLFSIKHTAGTYKLDVLSNSYSGSEALYGNITMDDGIVLIKVNPSAGNVNTMNTRIVVNKATTMSILHNVRSLDSVSNESSFIDTDKDSVINNNLFRVYLNDNDDVVFDTYSRRMKIKSNADPYQEGFQNQNEVYITGDQLFGYSTEKIKENISSIENGTFSSFIDNIEVKEFNYIEEFDSSKRKDVSIIIEELLSSDAPFKDILIETIKKDDNEYDAYRMNTMLMILLGSIKEQQNTIKDLTEKVDRLLNDNK